MKKNGRTLAAFIAAATLTGMLTGCGLKSPTSTAADSSGTSTAASNNETVKPAEYAVTLVF